MSKDLIDAIVDLREEDTLKIAKGLLDSGADPIDFLKEFREAFSLQIERFETSSLDSIADVMRQALDSPV